MPARPIARAYFAAQAVAGAAWWLAVWTVPAVRDATLGGLDPLLVALGDLPCFVLASAFAASGLRWAVWIVVPWTCAVAAGMALYATITGLAGWGALLMLGAGGGTVLAGVALRLGRLPSERLLVGPFAPREAQRASAGRQLARTAAQTAVFWGCFLLVIPLGIAAVEARWGLRLPIGAVDEPVRAAGVVAGAALLVAASALGTWSAHAMATRGDGTPLPAATARRLVVSGPYRWVRNPMAIAGIAQGVAVGLLLGSWLVVLYALAGSLLWNRAIRPHEEADLAARFGAEFAAYAARVACWAPRRPGAVARAARSS
ncbi:isoprenylcysteine carboxylmethyltransferase family protein [Leucobacter allii]|uniref:Isoprenylcysteine carboxylmethyltransferase family protein n=1 Tax=Leucobacter allii TaxID=2932247 RepID=A0ABY4FLL5_9MICO|nr:isoprenylcysteine carboxylmethyltransferase family protein [Leucobacter allii]UOQ57151.1 isoprenylcysteine carboxylmethyltransferase family protein [Leucobacter allii]